MKATLTLSLLYGSLAWLLIISAIVGIIYGLLNNSFDGLADLAPDIEYKQGVWIQTINGKQFIREQRGDGSIHFVPIN